jgi:hypothetical protein
MLRPGRIEPDENDATLEHRLSIQAGFAALPCVAGRVASRASSFVLAFNDSDLVGRQFVEFIDQTVDLAVERGAFAFIEVFRAFRSRYWPLG